MKCGKLSMACDGIHDLEPRKKVGRHFSYTVAGHLWCRHQYSQYVVCTLWLWSGIKKILWKYLELLHINKTLPSNVSE